MCTSIRFRRSSRSPENVSEENAQRYLGPRRGEASGLRRADVELEEQWREWYGEFEQTYSEGAFFSFVSERYMEVLIDFFRIDLLRGGAEARSSWRGEGTGASYTCVRSFFDTRTSSYSRCQKGYNTSKFIFSPLSSSDSFSRNLVGLSRHTIIQSRRINTLLHPRRTYKIAQG